MLCSTFSNLRQRASWVPRSPNRLHTLTSSLELAGRRPRSSSFQCVVLVFIGYHEEINKLLMSVPLSSCLSLPRVWPCIISGFDGLQALGCNWSAKKPLEFVQTIRGPKSVNIYEQVQSTQREFIPQDQYLHLNLAQQNGLNLLPMPYYPGTMPWYPTAPGIIPSTPTTPGILQNGAQPR